MLVPFAGMTEVVTLGRYNAEVQAESNAHGFDTTIYRYLHADSIKSLTLKIKVSLTAWKDTHLLRNKYSYAYRCSDRES